MLVDLRTAPNGVGLLAATFEAVGPTNLHHNKVKTVNDSTAVVQQRGEILSQSRTCYNRLLKWERALLL